MLALVQQGLAGSAARLKKFASLFWREIRRPQSPALQPAAQMRRQAHLMLGAPRNVTLSVPARQRSLRGMRRADRPSLNASDLSSVQPPFPRVPGPESLPQPPDNVTPITTGTRSDLVRRFRLHRPARNPAAHIVALPPAQRTRTHPTTPVKSVRATITWLGICNRPW